MSRTVAILGAGPGGLTTASRLRELLPSDDRIVLVDQCFESVQGLSLLWVLRGWRTAEQVRHSPKHVGDLGIDLLEAEVQQIDTERMRVSTDRGELAYDALVIALGAVLLPQALPGFQDALQASVAGEYYTLDGAVAVRDKLTTMKQGRLAFLVASIPFRCPAAPYEGALLAADLLDERGVRSQVQIDVYTPEPLPMAVAGPVVGARLVGLLEERDIGFHPNSPPDLVDPQSREIQFTDGNRIGYDYLVVIPPHGPPGPVAEAGFSAAGWVPVDPRTLRAKAPGVWALGDVALVTLENGKSLPKAAVFARKEAEAVASGLARHLGVDVPASEFTGNGYCYVEVGGGNAAKGEGNFYASPAPVVMLTDPTADLHREKEAEERDWIRQWGQC
jgi:sulfide:quinone oxidoreductase